MTFDQLTYAIALAQNRHFGRAAKQLGITQSNLSQQIKKLEQELGYPLFERDNKHVLPTRGALDFLTSAKENMQRLTHAKDEFISNAGQLHGTVVLGAIPTIGPYVLPKLLPRLRRTAPNLRLILREDTTSALLASIRQQDCDLGLLALPIEEPALAARKLMNEDFVVAVSTNSPLAKQNTVTIHDIASERLLILQEGHCFRDQALAFCQNRKLAPQIVFEGSNLSSVINLTAAGQGITIVPVMAVAFHPHPKIRYIPFATTKPGRTIGLAWRMTMPLTRAHRFIMNEIEIACRQSVGD